MYRKVEKNIFITVLLLLLFTACQKTIDLSFDDQSGNIVIDGNITNLAGPYYVRITKSVAFTEINQYPPVMGAVVIISDNSGQIDTLQYEADGRYRTTNLVAIPGNTYTLKATVNGTTYTAQSTLPQPVTLDGLQQDSLSFGGKISYRVIPVFNDPPSLGNYYRFVIHINGVLNKSYNNFSDDTNNGLQNIRPIHASKDNKDDDKDSAIEKGDTVTVEMQCIDESVYTYFTTLSQISQSGLVGGVTPANPPSNITNGALGVFSAHTSETRSIVIK